MIIVMILGIVAFTTIGSSYSLLLGATMPRWIRLLAIPLWPLALVVAAVYKAWKREDM